MPFLPTGGNWASCHRIGLPDVLGAILNKQARIASSGTRYAENQPMKLGVKFSNSKVEITEDLAIFCPPRPSSDGQEFHFLDVGHF